MTTTGPRRLPLVDDRFANHQNDAIAGGKVLAHEEAAHEKRNWVRLSYDCNNHCTFCLDTDAHNGVMRDNNEIKIQIVEGRKKGAERLILSGGEPTMHPNFLDFVKLGRLAGYRKIQTVTNGRMFAYPEFLATAAKNGLDEITFSLHGHTPKLHDALVGVRGAFVEETKGLHAALASNAFIVNIDIVINKQNIRHLPDMLETFIGWGVKEFDLLHIIPFGNAWGDAREHLFYDLDGNLEHLQRAFAYARRPDVHVWLNRFPPPYAEGYEDLIQDPYKLNDEVRGRREEFERYLALGQKLSCREPARCKYCYLQSLCDNLDDTLAVHRAPEADVVRLEAPLPRGARVPEAARVRVVAEDIARAEAVLRGAPAGALELELEDYLGLAEALDGSGRLFGRSLAACVVRAPDELARLLAIDAEFEVRVILTRDTEPLILAVSDEAAKRLVVVQPNYDRVSDAHEHDVDLAAFFAACRADVVVENVPACVAGRPPRPAPRVVDAAMLAGDGRLDMPAFTRRYVADGFYTKALRCGSCAENAACRGVHVNWVRAHGFAPLAPIRHADAENPARDG